MTIRDIITAMRRRWYVSVLFTACGVGLLFLFSNTGGIYSSKTVVEFTFPTANSFQPDNGTTEYSVIAFAGSVASAINNGRAPERYSGDDAPFYGAGLREGAVVGLRNFGNQWYNSFARAEIEIQIVGRTRAWVEQRQTAMIRQVQEIADNQQDLLDASASNRIGVSVVPLTLAIEEVTPARTSTVAAVAAIALAVAIVSAAGSVVLESRVRARRTTFDARRRNADVQKGART